MSIVLYTGNRIENIVDDLTNAIKPQLDSVFDKETIVVQSRVMAQWVAMQIASETGICANVSFLFPNMFIDKLFSEIIGEEYLQSSCFTDPILKFAIMRILPALIELPEFESMKAYLGQDKNTNMLNWQLKLYQMSEKIADIFDQYLLYRPDMIFEWEHDRDKRWQAILWRKLASGNEKHRAYAGKRLIADTKSPSFNPDNIPKRISFFGILTLPPFYFEILNALSPFCNINIFLINPSSKYWGDALSNTRIGKIRKKYLKKGNPSDDETLHLDQGNSLLASMGKTGKEFINLIAEYNEIKEKESYKKPNDETLLGAIQSDIFNFIERGRDIEKKYIDETDDSISIHSCHSPMREIEVLYGRLLYMFDKDPHLKPDDILVMMPDIETYSPYIHVFSGKPGKSNFFSLCSLSIPHLIPVSFTMLRMSSIS